MKDTTYEFVDFKGDIPSLVEDYLDFCKIDESILGWMLSLHEEGFLTLKEELDALEGVIPERGVLTFLALIKFFGRLPAPGDTIKESQFMEDYKTLVSYVALISLVKQGHIRYETAGKDSEWLFKVTPKGKAAFELTKNQEG